MTKGNAEFQSTIARRIGEKRGLGVGSDYSPWIKVSDFSSNGRSHMPWAATTGRKHHYFSDLELALHRWADFSPHICDIREQFPLFPIRETREIAIDLGIRHPVYPRTSVEAVLTTDIVMTLTSDNATLLARSVKYSKDLVREEVLEHLELEKQYWNRRGVDWRLVTELDMPPVVLKNLDWLCRGLTENFGHELKRGFLHALAEARPKDTLRIALETAGRKTELSREQAFVLFQNLVWRHEVLVDMRIPLTFTVSLSEINLSIAQVEGMKHAGAA